MDNNAPAARRRSLLLLFLAILLIILVVSIGAAAALTAFLAEDEANPFADRPFQESFNEVGNWGVGAQPGPDGTLATGATGRIGDGVYDLTLAGADGLYWATAGESLGNGRYEVDVTFVEGPLDNAGGLVLMFARDSFYFFALRGDGKALLARCGSGCAEFVILGPSGWFDTDADWGAGSQNHLRADVLDGQLTFYINNEEVAAVEDNTLDEGDVGVIVVSGSEGQAHFQFDNIEVISE